MESKDLPFTAVLNYELPANEIVARVSGSRTCEKCKAVFHLTGRPPKLVGVCDRCGGNLYQREDDRPESIKVRFEAYTVPATGSPESICDRTFAALTGYGLVESGGKEVDDLYRRWRQAGAKIVSEPQDKPWRLREFTVTDLDGNQLRVFYDFSWELPA